MDAVSGCVHFNCYRNTDFLLIEHAIDAGGQRIGHKIINHRASSAHRVNHLIIADLNADMVVPVSAAEENEIAGQQVRKVAS